MTLAIIDGDVLCYHACKPRWEKKAHIENDVSFVSLDDAGNRVALEFTPEEDQEYLMESWGNFKKDLSKLLDAVFAKDFVMAVKGPDNFRNAMYPEYKMNRHADPSKQNMFVPTLRKLAVKEELAVESHGREADDLIRIWAEQARNAGDDFVVCSIDKDLLCIPGRHFSMKKETHLEIDAAAATRFYYEQLLKGDPTDNIPGVPRIGDVKAKKLLADLDSEHEFQEAVVAAYITAYDDEWYEYLLSNGKMIHLQKNPDDYFSISDWDVVKSLHSA